MGLKHESLSQPRKNKESFENFTYRVQYGVGSRECNLAHANYQIGIPSVLQSLVSCNNMWSCTQHDEKVRHEHWDMMFDEGIRKYGPWSTPSSERVAVAAQDAKSKARLARFFGV